MEKSLEPVVGDMLAAGSLEAEAHLDLMRLLALPHAFQPTTIMVLPHEDNWVPSEAIQEFTTR